MQPSRAIDFPGHRAPPFSGVVLLVVGLVIALGLGGIEQILARHGFRPSVTDTRELWTYHRHRIDNRPETCVLVGSSRIRLGFSQTVFAERYPEWTLSNLACDGTYPLAVLRDLASDPEFRGVIVCSTTAPGFLRENWEQQSDRVTHAQNSHGIEPSLKYYKSELLEEHSLPFGLQMDFKVLALRLARGRALLPPPVVTDANRFGYADYRSNEHSASRALGHSQKEAWAHLDPLAWAGDVREVGMWIRAIQSRGGQVVLVRYPTSGDRWRREQAMFPRSQYWDHLAELTGAPTVHFKDYAPLDQFDCPDESHLDQQDVPAFTADLLDVLDELQVLERHGERIQP